MPSNDSTGVLLIAHGTRSQIGVEQFLALTQSITDRLATLPVEPAFLELAKPDIDEAVERLLSRGITRLVTMPLLLFAAGHIKRDIPAAVAAALTRRGNQHIAQLQAEHLGCHPALTELSRLRMDEVARDKAASAAAGPPLDGQGAMGRRVLHTLAPSYDKSCLLLVARGSRDDSATAEMCDFARLRQQDVEKLAKKHAGWAPPTIEVAFLAMARPLLSEKLAEVAAKRYSRVIVQPHFLFDGELVDSIGTQVAAMASNHPETDWLVTAPLADKPGFVTSATRLLQKVIFDRLQHVGIHVVAPAGDD